MPEPTDNGLTYTFKIRKGVKFHDGTPLTAKDVAASWNKIVHPPQGVASARQNNFVMVDTMTASDDETVVFKLKFAMLTSCRRWPTPIPTSTQEEARRGHALVREEYHGRAPSG